MDREASRFWTCQTIYETFLCLLLFIMGANCDFLISLLTFFAIASLYLTIVRSLKCEISIVRKTNQTCASFVSELWYKLVRIVEETSFVSQSVTAGELLILTSVFSTPDYCHTITDSIPHNPLPRLIIHDCLDLCLIYLLTSAYIYLYRG